MPRQKSFENVPEGYEVIISADGTPEIMKRVTIYMTPLQLEFVRIMQFELNYRKNWVIQDAIKSFMQSFPEVVKQAEENLKPKKNTNKKK